eukprot:Gb_32603 [translate_table: standard]
MPRAGMFRSFCLSDSSFQPDAGNGHHQHSCTCDATAFYFGLGMPGSSKRMDPVYLMSGNGRCSSANAVRGLGLQPLKHEWKTVSRFFNSLYSLKSCAGTPRYEWPLCVSVRRFPKEQVPGFSAIDCAIVPRSSSQRVIVATIDAEEKATQLAEEYSDKSDSSSLADLSGKYFGQPVDKTELEGKVHMPAGTRIPITYGVQGAAPLAGSRFCSWGHCCDITKSSRNQLTTDIDSKKIDDIGRKCGGFYSKQDIEGHWSLERSVPSFQFFSSLLGSSILGDSK